MDNSTKNPLIEKYLKSLEKELSGLSASDRLDVVQEIREHITEAQANGPDASDQTVAAILDRIGTPKSIAQGAYERFDLPAHTVQSGDIAGILLLAFSGFGITYLIGLYLLVKSSVLTRSDKITAFVPLVGLGLGALGTAASHGTPQTAWSVLLILPGFLGFFVALYLTLRVRRYGRRQANVLVGILGVVFAFAAVTGVILVLSLGGHQVNECFTPTSSGQPVRITCTSTPKNVSSPAGFRMTSPSTDTKEMTAGGATASGVQETVTVVKGARHGH